MKKVALITGASAGIGKETAKLLLQDGLTVYVAARRVEKMQDLAELGAKVLRMDVSNDDEIVAGINTITEQDGGVDVLINNAGFGVYGAVEDTSIDEARYQFEVNIFGLARLTQLVLPYMREKSAGTIINLSSMGGRMYTPLGSWYHATKHALEGFSDCLRLEVEPYGIDVVVVQPGFINTEFGTIMAKSLMKRSGEGAYAGLAKKLEQATYASYEKGGGSQPIVVAESISKIIKSPKPRTRYAMGKMSKTLMFLRRWAGDRGFDKIIMSKVK